ncbi:MAG TPA: LON peptidase substrate-binding domain-containing protein, partial [Polyangiaceae bacterium]|nr:LON peptidase substrate-binding domain-containing protein [Polyangiaceae bacterium]
MRRELPTHPHIDHLKKQAKDLLDAHKRGDGEALARIVASLPAFSGRSHAAAVRAPFALHDAQSTIAREYGFASWNDLRLEVERRASEPVPGEFIRSLAGRPLPAEVTAALAAAWEARYEAPQDLPEELPLIAFRDALLTPGAVAPIAVARSSSLAAVEAAWAASPRVLAVFSQREAAVEDPGLEQLYPVGCVAVVRERVATAPSTFIVVQGLRWASLAGLEPAGAREF